MNLSSTSQVSTLVREPARVGDPAAPVAEPQAAGHDGGSPAGGSQVGTTQTSSAVSEAPEPLPVSEEYTGGPGERYDIEV